MDAVHASQCVSSFAIMEKLISELLKSTLNEIYISPPSQSQTEWSVLETSLVFACLLRRMAES